MQFSLLLLLVGCAVSSAQKLCDSVVGDGGFYDGEAYENSPVGFVVLTPILYGDESNIVLTLSSELNSYFEISGINITVKDSAALSRQSLSRDDPKYVDFDGTTTCQGDDGLGSTYFTVVRMYYTNLFDPVVSSPNEVMQSEYTATNTVIHSIVANDGDDTEYELSYSIVMQTPDDYFMIQTNGEVLLVKDLDFEENTNHYIVINITDYGFDELGNEYYRTITHDLTVRIEDYDDIPPVFQNDQSIYSASFATKETGEISDVKPQAIEAVDGDVLNEEIAYRIVEMLVEGEVKFAINSSTGVVSVIKEIDEEGIYTVPVTAYQINRPSMSSTTFLQVTVLRTDENKPIISSPAIVDYEISNATVLDEGNDIVYVKDSEGNSIHLDVSDKDEPGASIIYTIEPVGIFQVDTNGIIFGQREAVFFTPRATTEDYIIKAINLDASLNSENRESVPVSLQVDIIEMTTTTEEPTTTYVMTTPGTNFCNHSGADGFMDGKVYEGSSVGDYVTTLIFDGDESNLNLTLTGDLALYFDISGLDIIVKNSAALSRDTPALAVGDTPRFVEINGYVMCEGIDSSFGNDPAMVAMYYTNLNEPNILSPSILEQSENLPVDEVVETIQANDGDGTDYPLTYEITNQEPEDFFKIENNGDLILMKDLDFEDTKIHTVTINVTDEGFDAYGDETTRSTTQKFTIYIVNYDDIPPIFKTCPDGVTDCTQIPYSANISTGETGELTNVEPQAIEAIDGDYLNATIAYQISEIMIGGELKFEIDSITGVVSVISPIDEEGTFTIPLTAYQVDKPSMFSTTFLEVTVRQKDENKPTITSTAIVDSEISNATVTDDGSNIVYVKDSSGDILDLDVSDDDDMTASLIYTIEPVGVFQVDTNGYIFGQREAVFFTPRVATEKYVIKAINLGASIYSENRESDPITLQVDVIEMTTTTEEPTTTYVMTTPGTNFCNHSDYENGKVYEESSNGFVVSTLELDGDDATVSLTLKGDLALYFDISGLNIVVKDSNKLSRDTPELASSDSDHPKYVVIDGYVICEGIDSSFENDPVSVYMYYTNLNAPNISSSDTIQQSENTPVNEVIETIQASDGDGTDYPLSFEILSQVPEDYFMIESNGDLVLLKDLDFEGITTHTVTIKVTDEGVSSSGNLVTLPTTQDFTINVVNYDDIPPVFKTCPDAVVDCPPSPYSANFTAGETGEIIDIEPQEIEAVDGDNLNAAIAYEIAQIVIGGEIKFEIDNTTGIVSVINPIEEDAVYTIPITAYQVDKPSMVSTTFLEVTVMQKDESRPVIFSTAIIDNEISDATATDDGSSIVYIKDSSGKLISLDASDDDDSEARIIFTVEPLGVFQVDTNGYIFGQREAVFLMPEDISENYVIKAINLDASIYSENRESDPITLKVDIIEMTTTTEEPTTTYVMTTPGTNFCNQSGADGYTSGIVYENSPDGFIVSNLLLDGDEANVKLTLMGDLALYFNITGTNIIVENSMALSRDTPALKLGEGDIQKAVVIEGYIVCDGIDLSYGQNAASVTMYYTNLNNPNISTPSTLEVFENSIVNEVVVTIQANDGDYTGYQLFYEIVKQEPEGFFMIESNGDLVLLKPLDFEELTRHEVTIGVMDTGFDEYGDLSSLMTEQDLVIEILNFDDLPPIFKTCPDGDSDCTESPYSSDFTVGQTGELTNVKPQAIEAIDGENLNATIAYKIAQITIGGEIKFGINSATGVVSVISPIDEEGAYTVPITAYQVDKPSMSSSTFLEVTVMVKDESKPNISSPAIIDNKIPNATVLDDGNDIVFVKDFSGNVVDLDVSDSDGEASLIYTIEPLGVFQVDTNGYIFGQREAVFFSPKAKTGYYTIKAINLDASIYSDNRESDPIIMEVDFIEMTTQPTTEEPTTTYVMTTIGTNYCNHSGDDGYLSGKVYEEAPNNTMVSSLVLNGDETNLNLMLEGDLAMFFEISGTSMVVKNSEALSRNIPTLAPNEDQDLPYVEIEGSIICVGSDSSSGNDMALVKMFYTNLEKPVFVTSTTIEQSENAVINEAIETIQANDGDGTGYKLTYNITDQIPEDFFMIDNDGSLSLIKPLDFEDTVQHVITIAITDSGFDENGFPSSLTTSENFIINVLNFDDIPPVFKTCPGDTFNCSQSPYSANFIAVETGEITNVQPRAIEAIDGENLNDTIAYKIDEVLIENEVKFEIDSSSGIVSVINPINQEGSYTIPVTAYQVERPSMFSTTFLVVTVMQKDESKPNISSPAIVDNKIPNATVTDDGGDIVYVKDSDGNRIKLGVSDNDSPGANIIYTIEPPGTFQVDTNGYIFGQSDAVFLRTRAVTGEYVIKAINLDASIYSENRESDPITMEVEIIEMTTAAATTQEPTTTQVMSTRETTEEPTTTATTQKTTVESTTQEIVKETAMVVTTGASVETVPKDTLVGVAAGLSSALFITLLVIAYLVWKLMKKNDKEIKDEESDKASTTHTNDAFSEIDETEEPDGNDSTHSHEVMTSFDADNPEEVRVEEDEEEDAGSLKEPVIDFDDLDQKSHDPDMESTHQQSETAASVNEDITNLDDEFMKPDEEEEPIETLESELIKKANEMSVAAAAAAAVAREAEEPPSTPKEPVQFKADLPPEVVQIDETIKEDAVRSIKIVTLKSYGDDNTDLKAVLRSIDTDMASNKDVDQVKNEIAILTNISERSHPNILTFYGSYNTDDSIHYAVKYAKNGNLRNKLTGQTLDANNMMHIMAQIAGGLQYLHARNITHGHIWAKSIMLDDMNVPMLTDIKGSNQPSSEHKEIMRWQAIEVIKQTSECTQATDVWSYGTLMWEIVSQGATPYADVPLQDLEKTMEEEQLQRPAGCSESLFSIMETCWKKDPNLRPDMYVINANLAEKLLEDSNELIRLQTSSSFNESVNSEEGVEERSHSDTQSDAGYTAF